MNRAVEELKKRAEEITEGLPVAEVVHVTETDTIVSYQGVNVYAVTTISHQVGELLLVEGTLQLPVKAESVEMGLINEWNHNAVSILRGISVDNAKLLRDIEQIVENE